MPIINAIPQSPSLINVNNGGTGVTNIPSGQVMIGNGTNPITTKAIDNEPILDSLNLITSGAVYDALSSGSAKISDGNYTGNGSSSLTLTFPFKPKILISHTDISNYATNLFFYSYNINRLVLIDAGTTTSNTIITYKENLTINDNIFKLNLFTTFIEKINKTGQKYYWVIIG